MIQAEHLDSSWLWSLKEAQMANSTMTSLWRPIIRGPGHCGEMGIRTTVATDWNGCHVEVLRSELFCHSCDEILEL